jgi:hypothetical protein
MAKIQIELPDETAAAARQAGLLTPESLDRLITDAIRRRQAAERVAEVATQVERAGVEPLSEAEIAAEVKAARVERRSRASGT